MSYLSCLAARVCMSLTTAVALASDMSSVLPCFAYTCTPESRSQRSE